MLLRQKKRNRLLEYRYTQKETQGFLSVSYTHLDVYKRQKVFGAKTTQGAKSYTLTVQDDKGDKKVYEGHTDAEYVRGALEELEKTEDFTLEGSESDYGLYIEKVNGLEADYNKDGAYWRCV